MIDACFNTSQLPCADQSTPLIAESGSVVELTTTVRKRQGGAPSWSHDRHTAISVQRKPTGGKFCGTEP